MSITPQRLEELLEDNQRSHSSFQIRHFIIRKSGLTPYGMYKQCLRELSSRWCGMTTKVAKHRDEVEGEDELSATLYREGFEDNFRDAVREFCEFYMLADWLKGQVGEITPETREALEEEYWYAQMLKQAAMDTLSTGRIGPKTIDNVSVFPGELRDRLFGVALGMPTTSRQEIQAYLTPQIDVPDFDVTPQVLQLTRRLIDDAVDDRVHALPSHGEHALSGDNVADRAD